MLRYLTVFIMLMGYYLFGNLPYLACGQDALSIKLHELDQLRNGNHTPFPFEQVESLGKELLNEYTKPEEQGQIYYHLTAVHGQSVEKHTDLIIQYAQTALALPLDPSQRLRLYVYWGDAIRTANLQKPVEQQKPFYEVRKVAVKPYLEGLKEMQKYKIPEQLPDLPGVGMFDISGPKNSPIYQQFKKQHDDQMAARKQAEFDRKLWFSHQTLMNELVDLYSKKPYAATELRQIAAKTLADPAQVEVLMKRIEANGALKDNPIPAKTQNTDK